MAITIPADGHYVLTNAAAPVSVMGGASSGALDRVGITVANGVITAIRPVSAAPAPHAIDLDGGIVLLAFVDPHASGYGAAAAHHHLGRVRGHARPLEGSHRTAERRSDGARHHSRSRCAVGDRNAHQGSRQHSGRLDRRAPGKPEHHAAAGRDGRRDESAYR